MRGIWRTLLPKHLGHHPTNFLFHCLAVLLLLLFHLPLIRKEFDSQVRHGIQIGAHGGLQSLFDLLFQKLVLGLVGKVQEITRTAIAGGSAATGALFGLTAAAASLRWCRGPGMAVCWVHKNVGEKTYLMTLVPFASDRLSPKNTVIFSWPQSGFSRSFWFALVAMLLGIQTALRVFSR